MGVARPAKASYRLRVHVLHTPCTLNGTAHCSIMSGDVVVATHYLLQLLAETSIEEL